jgi:hypothetical protein
MNKGERMAVWAITLVVLALAVWGGCGITKHLIMAIDKWGDTAPSINAVAKTANQTLAIVNRPCGGGHPCGTLAEVDESVRRMTDIATEVQVQVKQSGKLIDTTTKDLNEVANKVGDEVDAIKVTTQATTTLLTTTNDVVAKLDNKQTGIQPLLENANGAVTDVRAFMLANQQHAADLISNSDALVASMAGIGADGKTITDKLTADFMSPKPWWKKIGRYASDTYDYGALFARHTP